MTINLGDVLGRAWRILLKHKALWVLGFLSALGGGGSTSVRFPANSTTTSTPVPSTGRSGLPTMSEAQMQALLVGILALACVLLLIGLAIAVISLMANGGLMADATGQMRFGTAFRRGASRFKSLFGMRFVLALPTIVVFAILFIVVALVVVPISTSRGGAPAEQQLVAAASGMLCLFVPVVLILALYGVVTTWIKIFGDREIMLAGAGATEAIGCGWRMFKDHIADTLVVSVLIFVGNLGISLVTGVFAVGLMAPGTVLMVSQIDKGVQPGALVLFVLGLLGVIILSALVMGLWVAYRATLWTLIYRTYVPRNALPPSVNPGVPVTVA